ncbi:hypothetical protein Y695_02449 [Hydrogenophaga sp. T4]|nr:hypothetical protein Y695_02449 [Hydrogenophaga sp. T4]
MPVAATLSRSGEIVLVLRFKSTVTRYGTFSLSGSM